MNSDKLGTMEDRIQVLFDRMTESYRVWCNASVAWHAKNTNGKYTQEEANRDVAEYRISLQYTVGPQYIRILRKNAHYNQCEGFIVATDQHKRFKRGDLLKADGYKTPTLNFSRGNVFDDNYSVKWTGIG